MTTIAGHLANYAQGLLYSDLPETVVHEVKRRILDTLGCAVGAWDSEPVKIVKEMGRSISCKGGATILGSSEKTSPDVAAFVNGTMVRYLDFNDTYLSLEPAHPSDNIPTGLALAECLGKNGRELILAIALAYEVQCRLCDAASLRMRGWDHVTYGAFSASLAAGKLMGLDEDAMVQALGLAATPNIALRQTRVGEISMWKASAFANVARNAIFAAKLAGLGMTGPSPIFEGGKGFMKQISGPFMLAELGGVNGQPFKILESSVKYYPAEYHAQSAIEAALALRHEVGPLNSIASIEVWTFEAAYSIIGAEPEKWAPKSRETADHSLPYCVAAALIDGHVNLDTFSEERIFQKDITDLMKKISVHVDPELDKEYPGGIPNLLEIETKTGQLWGKKISFPKGHWKHPMTDQEVEAKFRMLAEGQLGKERADRILDIVWRIDTVKDIGELMSQFSE